MSKVKKIIAYEIIDSRGYPTIEGRLFLDNDKEVSTSIPAGTSIGKYEALELRDDDKSRFDGMGVSKAVSFINELLVPKLIGVSPVRQQSLDEWLKKADGTKNKSKLGANSTLLISQLFAKAAASELNIPLFKYLNQLYTNTFKVQIKVEKIPTPIFNVINGGKHANNNLEFQEFQIVPSSSLNFEKSYQLGVEIFHELRRVLLYRNANISVGEEGGFSPNFTTNIDGLEVISQTINAKKLRMGVDVFLGIDIAASNFFKNDRYSLKEKSHPLMTAEYIDYLIEILNNYTILVLEDPLNQDDFNSWKKLKTKISREIYLVADDLVATNRERLERAVKENVCTTVLVKLNQIGTVTETMEVIDAARKNNLNYIVSHRSGETNDDFVADFAVAVQSDFVKFGAPSRGERVAKYNRLWQIEREEL